MPGPSGGYITLIRFLEAIDLPPGDAEEAIRAREHHSSLTGWRVPFKGGPPLRVRVLSLSPLGDSEVLCIEDAAASAARESEAGWRGGPPASLEVDVYVRPGPDPGGASIQCVNELSPCGSVSVVASGRGPEEAARAASLGVSRAYRSLRPERGGSARRGKFRVDT